MKYKRDAAVQDVQIKLRDREEEFALWTWIKGQAARTKPSKKDCALSMGQQSQERNVAEKDAQMSSYKEEYV